MVDLDGLWAMEIGATLGVESAGVIVCHQGQLAGGNDRYFYVGQYVLSDNAFEGQLAVTHYNDLPSDLFGQAEGELLELSGVPSASEMDLAGVIRGRSDRTRYTVRLRRLSPEETGAD
jgi:hypothetical protein